MKINCYICTTVVSLPSHTFSRDPSSPSPLFPTERETIPSSSSSPPAFSSATPPVWFSLQGTQPPLFVYFGASTHSSPGSRVFDEIQPSTCTRCLAWTINPNFTGICFKSCAFSCLAPEMDLSIPSFSTIVARGIRFIWMDPFMRGLITDLIEIVVFFFFLVWKHLTLDTLDEYVGTAGK